MAKLTIHCEAKAPPDFGGLATLPPSELVNMSMSWLFSARAKEPVFHAARVTPPVMTLV